MKNEKQIKALERDNSRDNEQLPPQSDRIVVYGSRISGAGNVAMRIQEILTTQGISEDEARVDYTRYVDGIKPTFFATNPPLPERRSALAESELTLKTSEEVAKKGLMRRLRQHFQPSSTSQNPSNDRRVIPDVSQPEVDTFYNTRPRGVLIFPEMRQYAFENMKMSVPTPKDYIIELCEVNDVPYVILENLEGEKTIEQAVIQLLGQDKPLAIEELRDQSI